MVLRLALGILFISHFAFGKVAATPLRASIPLSHVNLLKSFVVPAGSAKACFVDGRPYEPQAGEFVKGNPRYCCIEMKERFDERTVVKPDVTVDYPATGYVTVSSARINLEGVENIRYLWCKSQQGETYYERAKPFTKGTTSPTLITPEPSRMRGRDIEAALSGVVKIHYRPTPEIIGPGRHE